MPAVSAVLQLHRPHRPLPQLPHVWLAPELARMHERVVPTGHAALDAELPGGGWPVGSLVELLQDDPAQRLWQLAVAGLAATEGVVTLVAPPGEPFCPALAARGLAAHRLLRIDAGKPKEQLWAAEQALRCRDVGAVLAWLPQAKQAELRRLHLAAAQHDKLLFVVRPMRVLDEASPARLRLVLQGEATLDVRIAKRQGPPATHTIVLPAMPDRLAALLAARKGRSASSASPVVPAPEPQHVLDRVAAVA